MRRTLFGIVVLLLTMTLSAWAQATQPCIVKQYNQKQPKTPLAGVEVMASNAGSTVSATDGSLTLSFRTLKPGDKVNLISAKKAGYEIFNTEAVAQWNISRNSAPFTLVLVKSEYMAQLKGNLTQSSTESYKAKYEKAVRDLERQKKEGKLKEDEYNRRYDELDASYQEQLKNLDNYIDQFARIDLSEVSAEEQRILDMVQEGKIEEAVKAYEELDITGKLRQARENKKALSEAKSKIEEEEKLQNQAIEELKAKQEREIATLKLAGGKDNYDKIAQLLKDNAMADTTDFEAVFKYAQFAYNQKDFNEAERFFKICHNHCHTDSSTKLVLIGNFYKDIQKYSEAEALYLSALERAREDSDLVWEDVAMNNLGLLYYVTRKFDQAETYYLACLNYSTKMLEQETNTENIASLASIQSNLGYLYTSKADSVKAENYLFSALKNYELACSQNPSKYRSELADMQIRIAKYYLHYCKTYDWNIYIPKDDSIMVTKAERFFNDALENYRQLYAQEPDNYSGGLSYCLSLMGRLYGFIEKPAMALPLYQESYDLENLRYKNNPKRYQRSLALSYNRMGNISLDMNDTVNAEKYYSAAFDIYEELYKESPNLYFDGMKTISKNLCNVYDAMGDTVNYEKLLMTRVKLGDEEYKNNPSDSYQAVVRRKDLGRLYIELGRVEESKTMFNQAQQIDSTENANKNLAYCYSFLGEASTKIKDFKKAKDYYLAAIGYYKAYLQESGKNSINDNIGETHWLLGDCYWKEKDTVKAETHYLQSLKYYSILYQKDPNNKVRIGDLAKTQHNLGLFYYNTGNYSQAEKYYLKSLENKTLLFSQKPDNYRERLVLTQRCLADVYVETEEYIKAEKYYYMAMDNYKVLFEKEPDHFRAQLAGIQYNLMYIYATHNKKLDQYDAMLDAALANYEVLYQNDDSYLPYIVILRNHKGWRHLQKEETDVAISIFESTYKILPEESASYLASGYNTKAYEYAKAEDYVQAIETIDKAISVDSEDANLYDSKGEILLMKGDAQDALEMWNKVLELDPDFLSKHDGTTPLYEQLKERGLIK